MPQGGWRVLAVQGVWILRAVLAGIFGAPFCTCHTRTFHPPPDPRSIGYHVAFEHQRIAVAGFQSWLLECSRVLLHDQCDSPSPLLLPLKLRLDRQIVYQSHNEAMLKMQGIAEAQFLQRVKYYVQEAARS